MKKGNYYRLLYPKGEYSLIFLCKDGIEGTAIQVYPTKRAPCWYENGHFSSNIGWEDNITEEEIAWHKACVEANKIVEKPTAIIENYNIY